MHGFCIDCEKTVERRKHHTKGCIAACDRCYRFGIGYPCATPSNQNPITCIDCSFVFATQDCYDFHKLQRHAEEQQLGDGRRGRPFKSICEMRYLCRRCSRVVYERGTGPQRQHQCARQQNQPDPRMPVKCNDCFGFYPSSQPCFI